MSDILFLVHRLPFPPDKGDKIRSYHLLAYLAERYDVHLGTFVDDSNDERYVTEVEALCASSRICRLNPKTARLRSARGLVSGQALSIPYYFDAGLSEWVDGLLETRDIKSVIAYSSPMAQYVMGPRYGHLRRIMDFVDVDSDKWRQYAEGKSWPMSHVYERESKRLLEFEKAVALEFDASIFVTPAEVRLFDRLAPSSSDKHFAVANGVATDFFDPTLDFDSPFEETSQAIVFTGMMDYWANVDAVCWFAREVFPAVREREPNAEFWIVGGGPTKQIHALTAIDGVRVTGRVPDVRPYQKFASVVVAPLRIARGIQNKVLEALSMGAPVICTSQAAAGLQVVPEMPVRVVDDAAELARCVTDRLGESILVDDRERARNYVLDHYSWTHNLDDFDRIHTGTVTTCA